METPPSDPGGLTATNSPTAGEQTHTWDRENKQTFTYAEPKGSDFLSPFLE